MRTCFLEVGLRSLVSSVCRDQRDKAGAELEREREEHRARETPPFLATDPIKVWSGGLSWFSIHRTPGYGDLVPKPLCFVITCPPSQRHCQLLFSGLEYWGKGGEACALVGVGTNLLGFHECHVSPTVQTPPQFGKWVSAWL